MKFLMPVTKRCYWLKSQVKIELLLIIRITFFMLTGGNMRRLSLLRYFTIYSLIAFVITGVVLSFFISNHIKNDQLENTREITRLTLNALLKKELAPDDFSSTLSKEKLDTLQIKFNQVIEATDIIMIKIWDKNGNILYSSNSSLTSQNFAIDKELKEALCNKSIIKISELDNQLNTNALNSFNKVVKIYEPIEFSGSVTGVFEVYIPYDRIQHHVKVLNRTVAIIMSLGLLILYLLLLRIIYNSSKTLISQNQSLLDQKFKLEESYRKLNSTYKSTVKTLANAIDVRDPYTAGHSERVAKISLEVGKMLGLGSSQLELLELAALFHDVGKLGIPDEILKKPGKLTDYEFEIIKAHPQTGVNILENIDFLKQTLPIILHHHEKFSGGGYPSGIKGDEIPIESRIIAVADTYDAMTSDRPYRKGLPHDDAIYEIVRMKGTQFDSKIVDAFLKVDIEQLGINAIKLTN
ncbi:HD-GYP domain-containing protein [Clostridium thermosuccinogenes]|nr:HD-GYP domain-containing protein [Pseudoclostridium thermosuccinogenes]